MDGLVRASRPPQALNLRGRAHLAIVVRQDAVGHGFQLEMTVVVPGGGRARTQRRTLSSRTCDTEEDMWMALRDFAAGRLVDLAEVRMDAPELHNEATHDEENVETDA